MEYYSKRLVENIHQIIFELDSQLGLVPNIEYRKQLVKAVYALRDLDLFISIRLADYSAELENKTTAQNSYPISWQSRN
jgi:hypothetical protein